MKTLYEELISLSRELLDSWRRPGRRAGWQPLPLDPGAPAATVPVIPDDDLRLEALARAFPRELFARLLLELPDYRNMMAESFATGNYRRLRENVHQILGAVAYCEASELEQELRQLRVALKADSGSSIEHSFQRTMQAIDNTLHDSGRYRALE